MCEICGTGYPWPLHFLFYDWWAQPYRTRNSKWFVWYLIIWLFGTIALLASIVIFSSWFYGFEMRFSDWLNMRLWGGAFS